MEGGFILCGMEPIRIKIALKTKLQNSTATAVVKNTRLQHYIASLIGFHSSYSHLLTISRYRMFLFLLDR